MLVVTWPVYLSPGWSRPFLSNHDFLQELGIWLDFGLARLMDMIYMFNYNVATCHQTSTCHWDHQEWSLLTDSFAEILRFCAIIRYRIGFSTCYAYEYDLYVQLKYCYLSPYRYLSLGSSRMKHFDWQLCRNMQFCARIRHRIRLWIFETYGYDQDVQLKCSYLSPDRYLSLGSSRILSI